nr:hypothetical protein [Tanacetum cinerariifolium]
LEACSVFILLKNTKNIIEQTNAIIWNPKIKKSVNNDVPNMLQTVWYRTIVGFGVSPCTSDPMLVKIIFDTRKQVEYPTIPSQVEVFTLSLGFWRSPRSNLPRNSVSHILHVPEDQLSIREHLSRSPILSGTGWEQCSSSESIIASQKAQIEALTHRNEKLKRKLEYFRTESLKFARARNCPVYWFKDSLIEIGTKLKKKGVAVDVVNFGDKNGPKGGVLFEPYVPLEDYSFPGQSKKENLEALVVAANDNDNSHILHVPEDQLSIREHLSRFMIYLFAYLD